MTSPVVLVVVIIVLLHEVYADNCPKLFLRYSANHSYCKPKNKSCNIMTFSATDEDKEQILKLHNLYRSSIATGQTSQPSAANMLEMQWDKELAAVAQRYADQCLYKHDNANSRRVEEFGVGQNLAMQMVTGQDIPPPPPDWKFAVNIWFSEIVYFQPSNICPFNPPHQNEYRHFSQLIWAKTFRVGCGYVLFKTSISKMEQEYTRLYVCNYGPSGNVYGDCVYDQGGSCSKCPENSCCGSSCGSRMTYDGLCKVNDNEAPKYSAPTPNLFYCGFQKEADCVNYVMGPNKWVIENTISDNFLEIVLNGGENSTILFKKTFKPTTSNFCITLVYRKGPNIDGQHHDNTASLIAYVPSISYMVSQPLMSYPRETRQEFGTYNLTISWDYETQVQLSFSVPPGKHAQFFDVKSILVTEGKCQS